MTLTIRESNRDDIMSKIRYAPAGSRIAFLEPEATEPQRVKLMLMLEEFSRKSLWNGRRLPVRDWRRMFLAAVRHAEVGPGVEEATCFVMFERDDEPSISEASGMFELLHKYSAEHDFTLSEE